MNYYVRHINAIFVLLIQGSDKIKIGRGSI